MPGRDGHVKRSLPFRVLRVDMDAWLGDQVCQRDLLPAEGRPDERRSTRIIRLIHREAFVAVKEHVQADRAIALRGHVKSCHSHGSRHKQVRAVFHQELNYLSVTTERSQVQSSRPKLRPITQVYIVGQTTFKSRLAASALTFLILARSVD